MVYFMKNPNLKWMMTGGTNRDPVARCYGSIPRNHGNLPGKKTKDNMTLNNAMLTIPQSSP